ncbi:hypothetical protein N7533_001218 [Penicillium manginii]|uniref:uncharacterized protein n=1 Tax=Penicillium manginii TaxID=203109 RepID=UPI002547CA9E|nr:uncharacterized protein N7533_001218 [Penicillium manginii]KAJ5768635.1 hypothetical protein N7533_001218 [Penicillium manginii]
MIYKSNYELHSRESFDSRRSPPPEELLSPLATLYPHVAALQPQYDPTSCSFTGYRHTGYWAAAYTTQPLDKTTLTRRPNENLSCRFVSKLRRFQFKRRLLSRDDFKYRRGSEATAYTA